MHVGLPKEAFAQPVGFTITRRFDGDPAAIDPIAGYEFPFDVPTLDADAQLSFVVDLPELDAAGRADPLNALGSGTATIVGKGDAPGSVYQAFPVCSGSQTPAADACVAIAYLAAEGSPTTGNPAFVRFDGVVGHFSTYAVALVRAIATDVTPPVVTVPANTIVDATGPAGANVTYSASAADDRDPSPSLVCAPVSGGVFPVGTTTVACTATDVAGNSASATFAVHVRSAGEQIVRLIDETLADLDLPSLRPALKAALQSAADALVARRPALACRALNPYIAAVRSAPARAFTAAEKAILIADAVWIKAVIGCA